MYMSGNQKLEETFGRASQFGVICIYKYIRYLVLKTMLVQIGNQHPCRGQAPCRDHQICSHFFLG